MEIFWQIIKTFQLPLYMVVYGTISTFWRKYIVNLLVAMEQQDKGKVIDIK